MTKLFTAFTLALALPAMAHAAAPAMECCAKMKAEGKECCCKGMGKGKTSGTDEVKSAPKR